MVSLRRIAKLQVGVFHSALPCAPINATSGYMSLIQSRLPWGPQRATFCSTRAPSCDITVQYKHGYPVLAIPLPSRSESCLFSLKPMVMNVGDLIHDVQREDSNITTATVLSAEGERLSSCTPVETLLRRDFQILIDNVTYRVHSPVTEAIPGERLLDMEDLKAMVHALHAALRLPRHHQQQERELLEKLDSLQQHLAPLEKIKSQVERRAESMCSWSLWAGLAVLSLQGGVLAWFTWWVYSWDIMEPVTYFLTFGTSLGFLSFFILTKQEFAYTDTKDRRFLHHFYRAARRQGFNVSEYNRLKEEVATVENNLRRLRKRIRLRPPAEQIQTEA